MQHEAAKPKGFPNTEEAPRQEPMRGSDSLIRRNPSTDQKKIRRQMAKKAENEQQGSPADAFAYFFPTSKTAVRSNCINCNTPMVVPDNVSFPECPDCKNTRRDAGGTPHNPYDWNKDKVFDKESDFDKEAFLPALLALIPELVAGAGEAAAAGGLAAGAGEAAAAGAGAGLAAGAGEAAGAGLAGAGEAAAGGELAAGAETAGAGSRSTQMLKDFAQNTPGPNGQQQQQQAPPDFESEVEKFSPKAPGTEMTASYKISTQYTVRADQLRPGDQVRVPTGQTTKIKRVRRHETSGKHVYVDTEGGTTVVPVDEMFESVPQNARQLEVPGYGVPGGTSNRLPFDPHGPGGSNVPTETTCPVCGSKGTLRRTGDHYTCSKCGYQENFGGAAEKGYSSSQQVIRTFTSNNRKTASAIAKRAQQVLEQEENK